MNFKEYVEAHRDEIHSKISEYLPIKKPFEYSKMVRDYSERQGKYVRPGMLMLCGELFGVRAKDLVLPAAIMQISEDWMLMHDDVEDDSELRRGRPAIHRIYGTEQAINAGDAVHIAMWKMVRDYMSTEGLFRGLRFFDKLNEILNMTVEGQYLDLKFTKQIKEIGRANEKMYFEIVEKKTSCYSVYGPMQLGATVGNQKENILDALKTIGSHAGAAFQIMDDVLDVTAKEKEFGKQRYGDLYEGKLTLIMLHAYNHASRTERLKINRIYKKDRKKKAREEIDFLVYLIEKYNSADYAYGVAMRHGELAQKALKENIDLFPDNEYKSLLVSAVTTLFMRKK